MTARSGIMVPSQNKVASGEPPKTLGICEQVQHRGHYAGEKEK